MDPLTELAFKHQTDKGTLHGFTRFYHKLFSDRRESTKKLLEVGIYWGASLFMWREYFPNATIYGMDLQTNDKAKGQERIVTADVDQDDSKQLTNAITGWGTPSFDIILDDGGHFVSQQRTTLETCWRYLAPGGIYVVEDLHTNILDNYPNRVPSFINESTTMHKYLLKMMTHGTTDLKIPMEEVEDVIYFSSVKTKSLTCAIFKKKIV